MEEKVTISAIVAILLLGGIFFTARQTSVESTYLSTLPKKEISLGSQKLLVWIADTPMLQDRGLMGITRMGEQEGMLFTFSESGVKSFWNKNTLLDLDIVWVAEGRVAGVSALPNEPVHAIVYVESPMAVDAVLEVNEGWVARHGVKVGDEVVEE